MIYNPYDHYFNKAKQQGYKARSAFKLEEIQNKFKLIDKNTKTVLDIGCAPGSWMQYTSGLLTSMKVQDFQIIGFDIKESTVNLPNVYTYVQDVTDVEKIEKILKSHQIESYCHSEQSEESINHKMDSSLHSEGQVNVNLKSQVEFNSKLQKGVDFIQSDMAPDTIGNKSIDAMRSIGLLEDTLQIYKKYLKPDGRFAIKIFMGPGFEEFVSSLKKEFGPKNIKIFKPKACRSISKETYVLKIS